MPIYVTRGRYSAESIKNSSPPPRIACQLSVIWSRPPARSS